MRGTYILRTVVDANNTRIGIRRIPVIKFAAREALQVHAVHLEVAQKMVVRAVFHHQDDPMFHGAVGLTCRGNKGTNRQNGQYEHQPLRNHLSLFKKNSTSTEEEEDQRSKYWSRRQHRKEMNEIWCLECHLDQKRKWMIGYFRSLFELEVETIEGVNRQGRYMTIPL